MGIVENHQDGAVRGHGGEPVPHRLEQPVLLLVPRVA